MGDRSYRVAMASVWDCSFFPLSFPFRQTRNRAFDLLVDREVTGEWSYSLPVSPLLICPVHIVVLPVSVNCLNSSILPWTAIIPAALVNKHPCTD